MADYEKFRLLAYKHWDLYLNSNQCYLGRSYAWLKRPGEMQLLSALTIEERDELFETVLPDFESALSQLWAPDHMNYSWLGNHFKTHHGHGHLHLIPRYAMARDFRGYTFKDPAWGKNYISGVMPVLPEIVLFAIRDVLRAQLQ